MKLDNAKVWMVIGTVLSVGIYVLANYLPIVRDQLLLLAGAVGGWLGVPRPSDAATVKRAKKAGIVALLLLAVTGCSWLRSDINRGSDAVHDLCINDMAGASEVEGYAERAGFDVLTYVRALCSVNEVLRQYEVLPLAKARAAAIEVAHVTGALPR